MPAKSEVGTSDTPPTLMSRSESLGRAPATNAWARTTERVPAERVPRSARTLRIASVSAASCERAGSSHGASTACGSR
jgi:hypothetical protein